MCDAYGRLSVDCRAADVLAVFNGSGEELAANPYPVLRALVDRGVAALVLIPGLPGTTLPGALSLRRTEWG